MKSRSKKRTPNIVNLTVKRPYPHRARGRAAGEPCSEAWSLRASRRDHDPGSRLSYPRVACMFTASRTGLPAYIRSAVARYVLFVSYAATTSKIPMARRANPAHLGIRGCLALRQYLLDDLDRALDLLVGHRFDAAAGLDLHLARHRKRANLQVRCRLRFPHLLDGLAPMQTKVIGQRADEAGT